MPREGGAGASHRCDPRTGTQCMSGYFNEPGITAQTLSPDGWLDTGDIGYQTAAGIMITGRKKDLIIINGPKIWPPDLEQIAEQQPEFRPGRCPGICGTGYG